MKKIFINLNCIYKFNKHLFFIIDECSENNGECTHFCFVTPNGRSCKCQDGWTLDSDQISCRGTVFSSLFWCFSRCFQGGTFSWSSYCNLPIIRPPLLQWKSSLLRGWQFTSILQSLWICNQTFMREVKLVRGVYCLSITHESFILNYTNFFIQFQFIILPLYIFLFC